MPWLSDSQHEREQFRERLSSPPQDHAPPSGATPGEPATWAMVEEVYEGLFPKPNEPRRSA